MTAKQKLVQLSEGQKVELIDVEFRTIQRYCSHSLPCFDQLFIVDNNLVHESQLTGKYYTTKIQRNSLPLPQHENDIRGIDEHEPTQNEVLRAYVRSGDIKADHLPILELYLPTNIYNTIQTLIR